MNLARITKDLIGIKYSLGSINKEQGLDCFSLIVHYINNFGYNVTTDDKYKGYTLKNYGKRYSEDPRIIYIGLEYISTILEEIEPGRARAGDILFAKIENIEPSFGIDGGNGNMIIVTESGVQPIEKRYYKVIRAFRCHKQYR